MCLFYFHNKFFCSSTWHREYLNLHEFIVVWCIFVNFVINSLEIQLWYEFNNNIFLWLNLEHLENQAEEWCDFDVSSENATHKPQFHGLVDQQFRWNKTPKYSSDIAIIIFWHANRICYILSPYKISTFTG